MKRIIALTIVCFFSLCALLYGQEQVKTDIPVKPKHLEMVLIMDKSGSMSGLESDTIGGFNSMIEKQREMKMDANVTTVLFDTNYNVLYNRVKIDQIPKMTSQDYRAGGNTALLDAIGNTINKIENVDGIYDANNKVLFVIITDGKENSSKEYSKNKIKDMIETKQNKNGWEFLFLGANIDAVSEARGLGISSSNAAKYKNDGKGISENMKGVLRYSNDMVNGAKKSSEWKKDIEKHENEGK